MSTPTILVTVDFSDCSPEVVEHAAGLAAGMGGRLAIVNVIELPSGIKPDTVIEQDGAKVTALDFLSGQAGETLRGYAEIIGQEHADLDVTTRVARGLVVDEILKAADDLDVSMIVLGTHGRRGLSRVVLGSVAEQVLRRAEQPVLTLRTQHKATCEARSCAWCNTHVNWAQSQIRAEQDG